MKADKTKAIDMFNKGEGGFRQGDLYPYCFNISDGKVVATIGPGLLALIAVRPTDAPQDGLRLLERILRYRIFADEAGKMNLSLADVQGGLLLVPQFTLAADTGKGLRPGFSQAATPTLGRSPWEP